MKVLKFGGTSVGSAQRIKNVASIVCDQEQKIVVLSAMAGTTNSLVEISECFHKKETRPISLNSLKAQIKSKKMDSYEKIIVLGGKYYTEMINDLFPHKEVCNPLEGCGGIGKMMKKIDEMINGNYPPYYTEN